LKLIISRHYDLSQVINGCREIYTFREIFYTSITAFITAYSELADIIHYLKLTFMAECPPPLQVAKQELLMAVEERSEYF